MLKNYSFLYITPSPLRFSNVQRNRLRSRQVKLLEIGSGSGRWARSLFPDDQNSAPVSKVRGRQWGGKTLSIIIYYIFAYGFNHILRWLGLRIWLEPL